MIIELTDEELEELKEHIKNRGSSLVIRFIDINVYDEDNMDLPLSIQVS